MWCLCQKNEKQAIEGGKLKGFCEMPIPGTFNEQKNATFFKYTIEIGGLCT